MKDLNGLEATAYIVQEHPRVRVLMLSMHDNEQYVTQALRVGASGYLLKEAAPTELEEAVKAVACGDTYLSQAVAKHVIADYRRRSGGKAREEFSPVAAPTPRELEILCLLAAGKRNKEITATLSLSMGTVKTHLSHIFEKLGVSDRTQAVTIALKRGLIRLE